jgi:hypothetical protein
MFWLRLQRGKAAQHPDEGTSLPRPLSVHARAAEMTSLYFRPSKRVFNTSNALPGDLPLASVKEVIGTGEEPDSNWLLASTGIEPYGCVSTGPICSHVQLSTWLVAKCRQAYNHPQATSGPICLTPRLTLDG